MGKTHWTCRTVNTCTFSTVSSVWTLSILVSPKLSHGRRKLLIAFPSYLPSISKFPLHICPMQLHLCVKPARREGKLLPCPDKGCLAIQPGALNFILLSLTEKPCCHPPGSSLRRALCPSHTPQPLHLPSVFPGPFPFPHPWRQDPLGHLPVILQAK